MTLAMLIDIHADYAAKSKAACVLFADVSHRLNQLDGLSDERVVCLAQTRADVVADYRKFSSIANALEQLIADVERAANINTKGAGHADSSHSGR